MSLEAINKAPVLIRACPSEIKLGLVIKNKPLNQLLAVVVSRDAPVFVLLHLRLGNIGLL